ncbi:MAG: DUF3617 family protein [Rhizomicrobium sp.]|jgi:hypothetical protein
MRVSRAALSAGAAIFAGGLAFGDTAVPHQKSGLWESSMTMMGKPITTQSCVTAESEAKMSVFSSQVRQKNCSASSVSHNLDGSWTSSSTCKFGPGAARTTHAKITGDFNSKLVMVVSTEGAGKPEMTMTMTWVGACKPGMQGGDVVMSNGMKMNVLTGTMSGVPKQ